MSRKKFQVNPLAGTIMEALEPRRLLAAVYAVDFGYDAHPQRVDYTPLVPPAPPGTRSPVIVRRPPWGAVFPNSGDPYALTNLSTDAPVDRATLTLGPGAAAGSFALTATGFPRGAFADGNYELLLPVEESIDPAAVPRVVEEPHAFWHLAGDINRDRVVDALDMRLLLIHYGAASGATYVDGDLNGDGAVNSLDYSLLASSYNLRLPPPPSASNSVTAAAHPDGTASVQWTAPGDGSTPDGYRVYRSTDGTNFERVAEVPDPAARAWMDGGADLPGGSLAQGERYWYRVRPYTAAAGSAHTTNKFWAVTPLPAPTELTATVASPMEVDLSWSDAGGGAAGFAMEMQRDGGPWLPVSTSGPRPGVTYTTPPPRLEFSGRTTATVSNLVPLAAYNFRAVATTPDARSAPSEAAAVTTPPLLAPPAAPSHLATGTAFSDGVQIAWRDNSDDEDFFEVEWSDGGGEWFVIDEAPAGATYYTDEYPVIGTVNHYRVSAVRDDGYDLTASGPSNEAGVRPITPPVGWHDTNAGPNDRGTLSPFAVVHDRVLKANVLGNDKDYDGPADRSNLTVVEHTDPQHGSVTIGADGGFTYTPAAGFVGTDTFTYTLFDGEADGAPATVAIDVTNAPPVADSAQLVHPLYAHVWRDGAYHAENPPLTGTVAAADADADPLTFEKVSDPAHGTVTINGQTGEFTYIVGPDFAGRDRFEVAATDGVERGPTAVINVVSNFTLVKPNASSSWEFRGSGAVDPDDILTSHEPGVDRVIRDFAKGEALTGGGYFTYKIGTYEVGRDSAVLGDAYGLFASKPFTYSFEHRPVGAEEVVTWHGSASRIAHNVSAVGPSSFTAGQTRFLNPYLTATLAPARAPEHGTLNFDPSGAFTYTPDAPADGGEPYLGWDFFSFTATEADGYRQEQWIQLNVGYDVSAAPAIVAEPEESPSETPVEGWQSGGFDGTLAALASKLSKVEVKKNEVLRRLEGLGKQWQTIHLDPDESADAVLANADGAVSALDAAHEAYKAYEQGWLELTANAAAYQKTYNAYADNWYSSYYDLDANDDPLDSYGEVLGAIQKLPRDIGGLRPTGEFLEKITAALDEFGDAAGFQSELAGTVYTVAETTHKNLERAEIVLGVATGGSYSAATLATKWGLAKFALHVAAELAANEYGLVDRAAAPVVGSVITAAERIGLNPKYVQVGCVALQATGVVKKFKLRPSGIRKWYWRLGAKVKLSRVDYKKVTWTKVDAATYKSITDEFNNTRRAAFLMGLANSSKKMAAMRKAGVSVRDIKRMRLGFVPKDFEVHHKKPRVMGGGNEDGNLMLIKAKDPNLHTQLSQLQDRLTGDLQEGMSRTLDFPMFEGKYFCNQLIEL